MLAVLVACREVKDGVDDGGATEVDGVAGAAVVAGAASWLEEITGVVLWAAAEPIACVMIGVGGDTFVDVETLQFLECSLWHLVL